jgi:hypothetical protein
MVIKSLGFGWDVGNYHGAPGFEREDSLLCFYRYQLTEVKG